MLNNNETLLVSTNIHTWCGNKYTRGCSTHYHFWGDCNIGKITCFDLCGVIWFGVTSPYKTMHANYTC